MDRLKAIEILRGGQLLAAGDHTRLKIAELLEESSKLEKFQPNPNCPKCRAAIGVGLRYYDCPDCRRKWEKTSC